MIYPYDSQFTPMLRDKGFRERYDQVFISSLPGWGLCGKDASYTDGGDLIGITVSQEFEQMLGEVDTVIFAETDNSYSFKNNILPKVTAAIEAGKNVIFLMKITEQFHTIREQCIHKGVQFTSYRESNIEEAYQPAVSVQEIEDCRTPILALIGLAEYTNKFKLELELKAAFEDMGYRVSVVGSRPYCEFMGFHSFPTFMNELTNESDKILNYNKYIMHIEATEEPDLIIIAVPGGFMRYNNKITNDFGITAYEIFQAVVPDTAVLSLFHERYTSEYIEGILNSIKYKLGLDIDAINIANRQIDWIEMVSSQPGQVSTLTLNLDFMRKSTAECRLVTSIPVFNTMEKGDNEKIANLIIDKLSEAELALNF
nr:TIGR04066 family peptide maturation system protein [Paenibacillus monticola]